MFTLFAGKFTPAASVEVQHITDMPPALKPSSIIRLSSVVNPVKEGHTREVLCDEVDRLD